MNFLELLTTIFGILMALSYFIQAKKILDNESGKDISLVWISIICVGSLIWYIYGLDIRNMPIILTEFIAVVGTGLVLVLAIIFRKGKR